MVVGVATHVALKVRSFNKSTHMYTRGREFFKWAKDNFGDIGYSDGDMQGAWAYYDDCKLETRPSDYRT